MKNFRNEYRAQVNLRPVPNDLFDRTRKAMRQAPRRRRKIHWGILIPACALIALGSVTAVAYGIQQFAKFSGPVYQKRIDSSIPAAVENAAGKNIQKSAEADGLAVTVNRTVCDNQRVYIVFTVKSTDSTPLQESSAYRRSQQQEFAETNLSVGEKQIECTAFRTDDASVPGTAQFEAIAEGDFSDLNGRQATLSLKDFTDAVDSCEDAGFLFRNLGELYRSMTPEPTKDFIRTGLFDVYADPSLIAPSWTIPAGKQRVKFSSLYPDSYIDNIGFHKTGEYGCQRDLLYLSITPGNSRERSGLEKLCFQNTGTGNPVPFENGIITGNGVEHVGFGSEEAYRKAVKKDAESKLAFNGGRIVLALDPTMDDNRLTGGCTVNDLDRYRIARSYRTETVVRRSGKWDIPFTLSFTDTARTFHPDQSGTTPDGLRVTVKSVTVSDLSLSFSGTCRDTEKKLPLSGIKLILKDGSKVEAGIKIGGGVSADGAFEFSGGLAKPVDAKQVAAIELFGARVPLTEPEN